MEYDGSEMVFFLLILVVTWTCCRRVTSRGIDGNNVKECSCRRN
jgi:hypothetical protein